MLICGIYPLNNEDRKLIELNEARDAFIQALIASEDRCFYEHNGISLRGISRAMLANLKAGRFIQGGSTLTQQLIKNSLLSRDKTLSRKVEEALMAILLELSYDKKFILERYMNTVYLGQQGSTAFHGFAGGSLHYFNKDVSSLNLREIATLVALLKGPTYFNPTNFPDRLKKRVEMILSMHKNYKKII